MLQIRGISIIQSCSNGPQWRGLMGLWVIMTQSCKLIIHFIPGLMNITCYAHTGRWNYFHFSRHLTVWFLVYCTHCMSRCVVLLCMLFVSCIYKLPTGITCMQDLQLWLSVFWVEWLIMLKLHQTCYYNSVQVFCAKMFLM